MRKLSCAILCIGLWLVQAQAQAQIEIKPEERCSEYLREDYAYPQSLEARIAEINLGGSIVSPYTNEAFASLEDTDIEHIVAISEAHDSGLCGAGVEKRQEFAQDLQNLTLASPHVNRNLKNDKDFAHWQPAENACWYAHTILKVKAKYRLSIDASEAAALLNAIAHCFTVLLEMPEQASFPEQIVILEKADFPEPEALGDPLDLYDDNDNGRITCAEARQHGIAPVHSDHPAFQFMRDADGDGIVCE